MSKIRVLVVDDSIVVRTVIGDLLNADPDIEVVGSAPDGKAALARIAELNPDVITLDVEMPVMDGIACLVELRTRWPKLPVLMLSNLTQHGAATTLSALEKGASDFIPKPQAKATFAETIAPLRTELLAKVKALALRGQIAGRSTVSAPSASKSAASVAPVGTPQRQRVDLVVVGISTGGPEALASMVPCLPGDLPVPVVVVQHMPPMFTRLLAERLAAKSPLRIAESQSGLTLKPGELWIAAGGSHLEVARSGTTLILRHSDQPPENGCRPAADVLFRSAAQAVGSGVLSVVMTGMGEDGLKGVRTIREAGGTCIAQDEATCVVWGMPGAVTRAGVVDRVLPLAQIAGEIVSRVRVLRPLWPGIALPGKP